MPTVTGINKPLFFFFTLSYAISWLIWLPLYGPVLGIVRLHEFPHQHVWGAFGPMVAAVIVAFFYKKNRIPQLLRGLANIKSFKLLIISIFMPFIIGLLSVLIDKVVFHSQFQVLSFSLFTADFGKQNIISFALLNVLTFGIGEETGWRGFALPLLQKKYSPLVSSLILTGFWAVWHLPLFLYRPGYTSMNISGIIGWLISLLTGSILLTWLFNASKRSILICAIFHATIDVAFTYPGLNKTTVSIMGMIISIWGVIIGYKLHQNYRQKRTEKH